MTTTIKDWGPGKNHIVLRDHNREFYSHQLFHLCHSFNHPVPLLIHDINTSQPINKIYVNEYMDLNYLIMINNWPIKSVKVFGKIIGEQYKESRNMVILNLDDCSGEYSTIYARLSVDLFELKGFKLDMNNYGSFVEVLGKIVRNRSGIELYVEEIETYSRKNTLFVEINKWKERLEYRREKLMIPWVHDVEYDVNPFVQQVYQYTLSPGEIRRRHEVLKLKLADPLESIIMQKQEDSMDLNKKRKEITDYTPIKLVNETQIILEICKSLIDENYQKMKLDQLYHCSRISKLLDYFTKYKIMTCPTKFNDKLCFNDFKSVMFHKIRHVLQVKLKLIAITKHLSIKSTNLQRLIDKITLYLSKLPENTNLYVEELKSLLIEKKLVGDINVDLLNGLIDYIKNDNLCWRYERSTKSWSFTG